MLDRDDCFSVTAHRAVYAAVRYLTEAGSLKERGSLAGDDATTGAVQSRFAAVLSRLVTAEQGTWRTGQAGVILHDLYGHATSGYMTSAETVLRAARQRWLLEALITARQMASTPDFDADVTGDMIRKLLEDALTVPPGGIRCGHRRGPVHIRHGTA